MTWTVDTVGVIRDENGDAVALLCWESLKRGPLIASAPELYEALKNIVREHREGPATDLARAALAKADGGK